MLLLKNEKETINIRREVVHIKRIYKSFECIFSGVG